MYKKLPILVVFILTLLPLAVSAGEWELVGEPTMNSLNFDLNAEFAEEVDINLEVGDFNGLGYYLGGRYWINEKFAVGAGYENISSDFVIAGEVDFPYTEAIATVTSTSSNKIYVKLKGETTISGFYGEAVYQINDFFAMTGGLGKYDYRLDGSASGGYDITGDEESGEIEGEVLAGDGYGYHLGFELKYPVHDSFDVIAGAAYRKVDFDIDKSVDTPLGQLDIIDIEVDGFTGRLGISYSF